MGGENGGGGLGGEGGSQRKGLQQTYSQWGGYSCLCQTVAVLLFSWSRSLGHREGPPNRHRKVSDMFSELLILSQPNSGCLYMIIKSQRLVKRFSCRVQGHSERSQFE